MMDVAAPSGANRTPDVVVDSPEPPLVQEQNICSPRSRESSRRTSLLSQLYPNFSQAIHSLSAVVKTVDGWASNNLAQLAQDYLSGVCTREALMAWLLDVFPRGNRPLYAKQQDTIVRRNSNNNKRALRRQEYARVQRMFKSNMSRAVHEILGDTQCSGVEVPPIERMAEHWGPFVSQPSTSAPTIHAPPEKPELSFLWHPISCEEAVSISLPLRSAPGPDGVSVRLWRAVPSPIKALLFNLVLVLGGFPRDMLTSRTVFVPKKSASNSPADYRPISVTSVIVRHLHKILASRLRESRLVDLRQRCFDDGCAENISALAAVIAESRNQLREVHVASLDVAKAFDSISHGALLNTLRAVGVPHGLANYVAHLYNNSYTKFEVRGKKSALFQINRGVRQGDPLSPVLFALVIDDILRAIPANVGFDLDGYRLDALAYADDILLFSSSAWGLQKCLERVEQRANTFGLRFNAAKCSVLSLVPSGKLKKIKYVTTPTFHLGNGEPIPQISSVSEWKYLGIEFSPEGPNRTKVRTDLILLLDRVTRAPLKPQQRLSILRCFLVPRLYHALILGIPTLGRLKALDIILRASVRRWLRLPKDTPSGFFHAPVVQGGLGIPSLATTVPGLMRQRLLSLDNSSSIAIQAIAKTAWVMRRIQWATRALMRDDRPLVSKHLRDKWWTHRLHTSTDGYELRECQESLLSTRWVDACSHHIPGRDFVQHVHVRINALPSLVRTTRGRRDLNIQCRAGCQSTETAAHVVQGCFRTHGGRVLRHNAVCRTLTSGLRDLGWIVHEEPVYHTPGGKRKPDLVCVRDGYAKVIDAQVVSGVPSLDFSHERKVAYYRDDPALLEAISRQVDVGRDKISFSTCTLTWRGIWSVRSADFLFGLGLRAGLLRGITTRVLQGSHTNWTRWNQITSRIPSSPCLERQGVG